VSVEVAVDSIGDDWAPAARGVLQEQMRQYDGYVIFVRVLPNTRWPVGRRTKSTRRKDECEVAGCYTRSAARSANIDNL
jgi:hypothetical protein